MKSFYTIAMTLAVALATEQFSTEPLVVSFVDEREFQQEF